MMTLASKLFAAGIGLFALTSIGTTYILTAPPEVKDTVKEFMNAATEVVKTPYTTTANFIVRKENMYALGKPTTEVGHVDPNAKFKITVNGVEVVGTSPSGVIGNNHTLVVFGDDAEEKYARFINSFSTSFKNQAEITYKDLRGNTQTVTGTDASVTEINAKGSQNTFAAIAFTQSELIKTSSDSFDVPHTYAQLPITELTGINDGSGFKSGPVPGNGLFHTYPVHSGVNGTTPSGLKVIGLSVPLRQDRPSTSGPSISIKEKMSPVMK